MKDISSCEHISTYPTVTQYMSSVVLPGRLSTHNNVTRGNVQYWFVQDFGRWSSIKKSKKTYLKSNIKCYQMLVTFNLIHAFYWYNVCLWWNFFLTSRIFNSLSPRAPYRLNANMSSVYIIYTLKVIVLQTFSLFRQSFVHR